MPRGLEGGPFCSCDESSQATFVVDDSGLCWPQSRQRAQTALISARGDAMEGPVNVKFLFGAGFGPIVRDTGERPNRNGEVLVTQFKEESQSYLLPQIL